MGAARAAGCHGEAELLPELCATNGFVPLSAFPPLLRSPPAPGGSGGAPARPGSGAPALGVSPCLSVERPGIAAEAAQSSRPRQGSPRATLGSIFCCAPHHLLFQF